jgi:hypothetical protein
MASLDAAASHSGFLHLLILVHFLAQYAAAEVGALGPTVSYNLTLAKISAGVIVSGYYVGFCIVLFPVLLGGVFSFFPFLAAI